MQSNFQSALEHVLRHEGAYSNHSKDPGGPTNFGITQAVLAKHRGKAVSAADVKALTVAEAGEIYRRKYWDLARCDDLPSGIDLATFDCAVNQGVSRATRLLQQSARVKADGKIGPVTLAAVRDASPVALLIEFCARRMNAYGRLQKLFPTFGLGWSRRLMATEREALALIEHREAA